MNYSSVLDYMYKQLPMYQRVGAIAYKKNLNNIIELCEALNNPHNNFKTIHIAGTNGKGSVSHMLASVFQCAGYKTGLYTSPHLKDFRERIKINGSMISKHYVTNFITDHQNLFRKIKPSFFEMTVAMAFDYFSEKKVDIAIIETGLGGRLDSTNIINPELSIITNVSLDHTLMLGNTIKKISKEKAGIIKKNVPLVLGEYNKAYFSVINAKSKKEKAPLYLASKNYIIAKTKIVQNGTKKHYSIRRKSGGKNLVITSDLIGSYQKQNILTVIQSLELLKNNFNITTKAIKEGFKYTCVNTGLLGRWQIINKKPLTIVDTGHNQDALIKTMLQLNKIKHRNLHFVIGLVVDKSLDQILPLLPKKATYYFSKAKIERALDQEILKCEALKYNLSGNSYSSVKKAFNAANKNANIEDVIFIGGSTFICAEVL